jgi:hypothetical protein
MLRNRLASVLKRVTQLESSVVLARRRACRHCHGAREVVRFFFDGEARDDAAPKPCAACGQLAPQTDVVFVIV